MSDFVIENGVLKKYKGNESNVVIPDGVTSVDYDAFSDCKSLESITIPNSVTKIGHSAFSQCYSLRRVTIPNSVTSIEYNAFLNCKSLESITIPNSVTSIGDGAFSYCASLRNITIPNSVKRIYRDVFTNSGIKDICYPGTKSQWENIDKVESEFYNIVIHFNYISKDNKLVEMESEARKLLSEGKTEKEVYATLKDKNIPAQDIVGILSKVSSNSEIVSSYCSEVIVPNVIGLFKKSSGTSKYTVGDVAKMLYEKYPEDLVNKAIVSVLSDQYLVD